MAEQVVGLRIAGMRRTWRDDPGGQQAGQREAGRYQHPRTWGVVPGGRLSGSRGSHHLTF